MSKLPNREDINEKSEVRFYPKESGRLKFTFNEDQDPSTFDFELYAQERKWPFGGKPWSAGDAIFSIGGTNNVTLQIDIPQSKIESWDETTMEMTLYATDDSGTKWLVEDFTITVAQGE